MCEEIIMCEKHGGHGNSCVYFQDEDQTAIVEIQLFQAKHKALGSKFIHGMQQLFLPHGYPDSVSNDYLSYQLWDTLQAFCSTLTGTLTTEAVMKGVGVGDVAASPIAATVTWILKDGMGMIGKISFAWWKGTFLDADFKKWRFFADILNDCALFLELLLPSCSAYALPILCMSSTMKAIVGVAGGATRAAITQHQAIAGNLADVSAKDGSQETFVNLIASAIGVTMLTCLDVNEFLWPLFTLLIAIHIFANYKAVRCVTMLTLNMARYRLLLWEYLRQSTIVAPSVISQQEPVLLGRGMNDKDLCGYRVLLGTTLQKVLKSKVCTKEDFLHLFNLYKERKYMLVVSKRERIIYVSFHKNAGPDDELQSYFHAILLGLSTDMIPEIEQGPAQGDVISNDEQHTQESNRFNLAKVTVVNGVVDQEFNVLKQTAQIQGWNMRNHHLIIDEWRAEWGTFDDSDDSDLTTEKKFV